MKLSKPFCSLAIFCIFLLSLSVAWEANENALIHETSSEVTEIIGSSKELKDNEIEVLDRELHGKGKGKSSKSPSSKGKGKGKSSKSPSSKGKGKGKKSKKSSKSPKGKGKGKSSKSPSGLFDGTKGKGKSSKSPSSKGKGKGKSSKSPSSKGKGKGKSSKTPSSKGKGKGSTSSQDQLGNAFPESSSLNTQEKNDSFQTSFGMVSN